MSQTLDYIPPRQDRLVVLWDKAGLAVTLPPRTPSLLLLRPIPIVLGVILLSFILGSFQGGLVMQLTLAAAGTAAVILWQTSPWRWHRLREASSAVSVRDGELHIADEWEGKDLIVPCSDLRSIAARRIADVWWGRTGELVVTMNHKPRSGSATPTKQGNFSSTLLQGYTLDDLETVAKAVRAAAWPPKETVAAQPLDEPPAFRPPTFRWPAGVPRTMLRTDSEQRRLNAARRRHEQLVERLRRRHRQRRQSGAG